MQYLVTKALLDLHDKYDGDLGHLDDSRSADKQDREAFSAEQIRTLGEYLDNICFARVGSLSEELRMRVENRIKELEEHIAPEVIAILQERSF